MALVKFVRRFFLDALKTRRHTVTIPEDRKLSSRNDPKSGTGVFSQEHYAAINRARLEHLDSLSLPIEGKSVLDVGCGPGDLAQFFLKKGCKLVGVDGRQDNIDKLKVRHPGIEAHVADVDTDSFERFGSFDIVFCYGLLYHIENPVYALRKMANVCKEMILVETVVCDHEWPVLRLEDESGTNSQALRGLASRPSPSFVAMALDRIGFQFVYMPNTAPDHPQFRYQQRNDLAFIKDGHLIRGVFVASRKPLESQGLVEIPRRRWESAWTA